MRIPEVVLVTLPERFGIGWRHLLDLMTECNELTRYVMRSHAGFDADEGIVTLLGLWAGICGRKCPS